MDNILPVRVLIRSKYTHGIPVRRCVINREYAEDYTNTSLIMREDFSFGDGLFEAMMLKIASTIKRHGTMNRMKMILPNVKKNLPHPRWYRRSLQGEGNRRPFSPPV
ncbi:hypothetical protein AFK69_07465 [Xenorhabdus sp. GDc328]|nr:hypothetical protein AAY47_17550 [Xenorhabdus griffiniae]KOP33943.1 hypothetical protein AFK69_07465 [Xenorhabdus sp. GDc328]